MKRYCYGYLFDVTHEEGHVHRRIACLMATDFRSAWKKAGIRVKSWTIKMGSKSAVLLDVYRSPRIQPRHPAVKRLRRWM